MFHGSIRGIMNMNTDNPNNGRWFLDAMEFFEERLEKSGAIN
jgi:hypothetical protein